jgi:hypothetical protein
MEHGLPDGYYEAIHYARNVVKTNPKLASDLGRFAEDIFENTKIETSEAAMEIAETVGILESESPVKGISKRIDKLL